jgi:hypothetical protein
VREEIWAKDPKEEKPGKKNPNTPANKMERTIIIDPSSDTRNDISHNHHM